MVMEMLRQPNAKAAQPWDAGISALALGPHEYEPPDFANMIAYALEQGAQEITEEEYLSLLPASEEP